MSRMAQARGRLVARVVRSRWLAPLDVLLTQRPLVFGDRARLHVDPTAVLNDALLNTVSGSITVGPHAFCGHRVSLLTGTHDIARRGAARAAAIPESGRDIVVEEGVWLASGAMVLGPCRIGAHAVVAAGAVVTGDVEPGTIVGGVPARVLGRVP